MSEQFNLVDPIRDETGCTIMEVETDAKWGPKQGLLWTGCLWVSVEKARELRAWLDKVIP